MRATSIWRLSGSNGRILECFMEARGGPLQGVTVVLGTERLLDEIYPDEASARVRAMQVRDTLLSSGGWVPAGSGGTPEAPPSRAAAGAVTTRTVR